MSAVDEHWATSCCQYDWCHVPVGSKNNIVTLHIVVSNSYLILEDEMENISAGYMVVGLHECE